MGRMLRKKKNKNNKAKSIPISLIELAAFHEAGHAIIDIVLGIPFDSIQISEKNSEVHGMVKTNQAITNQINIIMAYLSGQIATEIRCGKVPELRGSEEAEGDNELTFEMAKSCCLSYLETFKFMDWCHTRATNLLKLNWAKVERLASELMARRCISYEEAKAVFSEPETTVPEVQGSTIGNG